MHDRKCVSEGSLRTFKCAEKTWFLQSLSFFSLNAQVSALIALVAILLWKLTYLLSAISLCCKGLTLLADFCSLPIAPISKPYISRTAQLPEVAIFGVPATCEGNVVMQFLNVYERAATVILCTRKYNCHNTRIFAQLIY